nr:5-formyltetrahydrofolate cyclo-ligase [Roseospira goensis]
MWRTRLLAARRAVAPADAAVAAEAARDHLLAALPPAPDAVVAGYWPMRGELDPRPVLTALRARGHPVALPVTPPPGAAPVLEFRLWDGDPAGLAAGPFKTRQPPVTAPAATPTWIVAPLLGFDRRGTRLGYGGGYYDRHLSGAGVVAIGYAFACQEVPLAAGGLPVEPHDIPLAAVVTETEVIRPQQTLADPGVTGGPD